jgi:hypothetical protein
MQREGPTSTVPVAGRQRGVGGRASCPIRGAQPGPFEPHIPVRRTIASVPPNGRLVLETGRFKCEPDDGIERLDTRAGAADQPLNVATEASGLDVI